MNLPHVVRVARSRIREVVKRVTRSPKWAALERRTKSGRVCAACSSPERIQVHHKQPFHLHPELELDPDNLLCLCMSENECHLRLGHGDNFKCWNPNIEAMAASFKTATVEERVKLWSVAKITRREGA